MTLNCINFTEESLEQLFHMLSYEMFILSYISVHSKQHLLPVSMAVNGAVDSLRTLGNSDAHKLVNLEGSLTLLRCRHCYSFFCGFYYYSRMKRSFMCIFTVFIYFYLNNGTAEGASVRDMKEEVLQPFYGVARHKIMP